MQPPNHHSILIVGKDEKALENKAWETISSFLPQMKLPQPYGHDIFSPSFVGSEIPPKRKLLRSNPETFRQVDTLSFSRRGIRNNEDPDLLLIVPQNSIGIDRVREAEKFLNLKPYSAQFRVVYFKDARLLTPDAQNALLKTLEEPPKSGKIILAVGDKEDLLPTVVSRCLIINLNLPFKAEVTEDEQKAYVAELEILLSDDLGEKLGIAQKIAPDAEDWFEKEIIVWRDLLLLKEGSGKNLNFKAEEETLKKIASRLSPNEIAAILKSLIFIKKTLDSNVNPRMAVEVLLLEFPIAQRQNSLLI